MQKTSDAIAQFTASLRARHTSANTLKAYSHDLSLFAREVPAKLKAIDQAAIHRFLQGEGVSAATRRRRAATLNTFYRWLVRQEWLPSNPMERLERVKAPSRLPRPLPPEAVAAILAAIPASETRDRALFTLLYETGMRVGEALSLQYTDIDLTQDDEKVRVLGKGQRERTVLLAAAPESLRLLKRHLKASGITAGSVFRGDPRYGGSSLPLDYSTLRRAWLWYCQQAGVAATIHQLRHSRASELIQAGVPLGTIRKLLGHRNIQSTMLYAEVDPLTVKRDLLEYQRRKGRRR